jgi:drug/metabolite transporter (DMT)-like permease
MGTFATVWVGPAQMGEGKVIFMVLTGALVLPVSFIALSLSSRYTHAANVSLIMLLETMMSPLWVWLVLGESPSARMFAGGAIVLGALLVYIVLTGRRTSPSKNDNPCR